MTRTHLYTKILAVVAAAVAALFGIDGASSQDPGQAPTRQEPSAPATETPEARTAQDPSRPPAEGQDPEEFRLTERETFGTEGQSVRVGDTQFILTDIHDFAGSANDLFLWGWLPSLSGDIGDNAFVGGQSVDLAPGGTVGGDMFVFAQTAEIGGEVGGDLYTFAAELTIAETGTVGGAMYGSAAALTINGTVGGPISLACGAVVLNGRIAGDVRIEAGELELGPNAVIEGDLVYESPRQATIDPGAQVLGQTRYFAPQEDDEDEGDEPTPSSGSGFSFWGAAWRFWWLLASFIVGSLALAVGGETARRPAAALARQPALGLGFGFVVAVVLPAAAILAIVLLITIPVGLIAIALYAIAVYLARLVAAQTVGDRLLRYARGGAEPSAYASLALGLVLFQLLTEIPYVGFLVWLAAVVGGLGGIFLAARRRSTGDAETSAAPPASVVP